MQMPKSALNPWSSRNGNSLVVIAAEHDTWANYSVWEAELISPDAASYWHSYKPSGTWARILLIRHFSLLATTSQISTYYTLLYIRGKKKEKRKKQKYVPTKKQALEKSSQKKPEGSEQWSATLLQEQRMPVSTTLQTKRQHLKWKSQWYGYTSTPSQVKVIWKLDLSLRQPKFKKFPVI